MLKFIPHPDGDKIVYELVDSKFTFAEARAMERVTGHPFSEMLESPALMASTDATQAVLWISMKRVNPTTTFSDLDDIAIDGIEWIEDPSETAPAEGGDSPDPTDAANAAPVADAPPSPTTV